MMRYARIDLSKTNYNKIEVVRWAIIHSPAKASLNRIYTEYCRYKKFKSVMPIFESEYSDDKNDIMGYFLDDRLIAFSLLRKYDTENLEAIQFAWDYKNPELQLGIESLKHECAFYKAAGYKYYYLGGADEYKKQFDGFEMLGPA